MINISVTLFAIAGSIIVVTLMTLLLLDLLLFLGMKVCTWWNKSCKEQ